MMKWIVILCAAVLLGGTWYFYLSSNGEIKQLEQQILNLEDEGDPQEEIPAIEGRKSSLEGQRTFSGILLTFLTAGLLGILFVIYVLPAFAQRLTHAVYDSGEMVEKDPMHDARSLVAQGNFEGAIEAFRIAADADPSNRLPWVEIAKIQKDHFEDPAAAIETMQTALNQHEWKESDAAYFLFRIAELYDESSGDRASAITILQQVTEQFPETRHSANARHKLHEWGVV